MYRLFLFVCAIAVSSPTAWCKAFNFRTDTFAFANQTYFDYKPLSDLEIKISRRKGYLPDYSRHCFQLVRAVVQFHQFAEFRPELPKVSESDYRKVVRRVCKIPVWSSGPKEKVVVPGYKDLRSFSLGQTFKTLQKNIPVFGGHLIGELGNWRIKFFPPRVRGQGQEHMANWLRSEMDAGRVRAVYITRFKPINHCLVVYHFTAGGEK